MADVLNRRTERARYQNLYSLHDDYICKGRRLPETLKAIGDLPRGSYLDVGCGTRQMLVYAKSMGFGPVVGIDHACKQADLIGSATDLPFKDNSFDVVVMLDVLEHLVPGDEVNALSEVRRVARNHVLVSANNNKSVWDGFDLHINKRPYDVWDSLVKRFVYPRAYRVALESTSPMWRADF